MKVDIQRIEAAYFKLRELHARLEHTTHRMKEIRAILSYHSVGSKMTTDRIIDNLNRQISELDQRANGFMNLADALRDAMDEYHECEKQNRDQAANKISLLSDAVIGLVYPDPFVLPLKEKEIIHQYIMPLITLGKQGTT